MKTVGSRAEVMHGHAAHTSGGLKQKDLILDKKDGRIKSKAQVKAGKSNPGLKAWLAAQKAAKKDLGIKKGEFSLMEGELLTKTKKHFKSKHGK